MLFPIFLLVCFFLVYIGVYQYDRCIVQQSLQYTMVRGKELSHASEEEYEDVLMDLFDETLEKQYLIAFSGGAVCEVTYDNVELIYIGNVSVPWFEIMNDKSGKEWEVSVGCKEERWKPVNFVRFYSRLKGE